VVILEVENPSTDDSSPIACVSKGFQSFGGGKTPTFMDSGASDTMFISKDAFIEYKITPPRTGDSAKAINGDFEIVGEGKVIQRYLVDGKEREIMYTRALHTPTLNANLISVSAFNKAGLTTTFGGGRGVIRKGDGSIVLSGRGERGMYVLDAIDNNVGNIPGDPLAMGSLSQSIPLEQWHRRFSHCSPLTIQEMGSGNLVDGLKISDTNLCGKCEDCILGSSNSSGDPLVFNLEERKYILCPSLMQEHHSNMVLTSPTNLTPLLLLPSTSSEHELNP